MSPLGNVNVTNLPKLQTRANCRVDPGAERFGFLRGGAVRRFSSSVPM